MTKTLRQITTLILTIFVLSTNAQTDTIKSDTARLFKIQQSRQAFWDSLPKPTGWVNDFEDLYSDIEERSLDSIISIFKGLTSIEIAVVTIDSAFVAKDNFDDLTFHIANIWGVGEKEKDNGILIGISKGHRKMRIQNGYGIEKLITDNETKVIVDNDFIPYFKNGKFYDGTLNGLTKLIELLNSKLK